MTGLSFMRPNSQRRCISTFTAGVLLVQWLLPAPRVCACEADARGLDSCCGVRTTSPSCCANATSCCRSGECVCRESVTTSGCGCEDQSDLPPCVPNEKSERTASDVENSPAIMHAGTYLVLQSSAVRHALVNAPYDRPGAHSVQALLCIWQT